LFFKTVKIAGTYSIIALIAVCPSVN